MHPLGKCSQEPPAHGVHCSSQRSEFKDWIFKKCFHRSVGLLSSTLYYKICTLACIICGKKKYWGKITWSSKCYFLHIIQSGRNPYHDTTISSSLDFYYTFLRKRNYQAVVSVAEKKFWVFRHGLFRRPSADLIPRIKNGQQESPQKSITQSQLLTSNGRLVEHKSFVRKTSLMKANYCQKSFQ